MHKTLKDLSSSPKLIIVKTDNHSTVIYLILLIIKEYKTKLSYSI